MRRQSRPLPRSRPQSRPPSRSNPLPNRPPQRLTSACKPSTAGNPAGVANAYAAEAEESSGLSGFVMKLFE
jgi:hypothetical protein